MWSPSLLYTSLPLALRALRALRALHGATRLTACAGADTVLRAPLTFLRSRQKANGGIKLLAPIRGSIQRLEVRQVERQDRRGWPAAVKRCSCEATRTGVLVQHRCITPKLLCATLLLYTHLIMIRQQERLPLKRLSILCRGRTCRKHGAEVGCVWGHQRAQAALENLNAYDPDPVVYKSVLNNVRSASLNCYLFEARRPPRHHPWHGRFPPQPAVADAQYCRVAVCRCTVATPTPGQGDMWVGICGGTLHVRLHDGRGRTAAQAGPLHAAPQCTQSCRPSVLLHAWRRCMSVLRRAGAGAPGRRHRDAHEPAAAPDEARRRLHLPADREECGLPAAGVRGRAQGADHDRAGEPDQARRRPAPLARQQAAARGECLSGRMDAGAECMQVWCYAVCGTSGQAAAGRGFA